MGVTPVDELGLIEQTCSLSSYSGVGEGVGVLIWEIMRCKMNKTYILVTPRTLSDILVLDSEPFKDPLDSVLTVSKRPTMISK